MSIDPTNVFALDVHDADDVPIIVMPNRCAVANGLTPNPSQNPTTLRS
jgi:hypothetical protein